MISNAVRAFALCSLMLIVDGCATQSDPVRLYQGPARAPDAVATLSAPTAIELLALDSQEVKLRYGAGGDYRVQLLPGPHTLGVIYKEFWGTALNGGVVVSDVYFIKFDAERGARYQLAHDGPRDVTTASGHWDKPRIWLVDTAAGRRIDAYRTEKHIPAVVRAFDSGATDDDAQAALSSEDALMRQDALKRLKFWWKLAGAQDRTMFGNWLGQGAPPDDGRPVSSAGTAPPLPPSASAEERVMQQDALKHLKLWWKLASADDRTAFRAWLDRGAPAE